MGSLRSSRRIISPSRWLDLVPHLLPIAGPLAAVLTTGCEAPPTTSAGPSPVKCQVALTSTSAALQASGETGIVSVTTAPECAWNASAEVDWISDISPASGQGSGRIDFRISANPNSTTRQADIIVNEAHARVLQAATPCRFDVGGPLDLPAAGGNGSVTVATLNGCVWTARSEANWISLTASSGTGTGIISFSAAPNTGSARSGTLAVEDQKIVLRQAGSAATCTYTIAPTTQSVPAAGGNGSATITTNTGCQWTAASNASWLTITSNASGSGDSTIRFNVVPNTGAARTATLTIGGQTATVAQQGQQVSVPCVYAIAPTSQTIHKGGRDDARIAVTTTVGCAWTAGSNVSWITITSGASGTGPGTVLFSVAKNNGPKRSGTLTVAGQTFTVDQDKG